MTEIALIGKKIGMTREFYKTGQSVPVTVVKVEKGRVIQVIDEEKRTVVLVLDEIPLEKLNLTLWTFFGYNWKCDKVN